MCSWPTDTRSKSWRYRTVAGSAIRQEARESGRIVGMGVRRLLVAALVLSLPAACSPSKPNTSAPPVVPVAVGTTVTVKLDERPFRLYVPSSYVAATKIPLVVLLHGYSADA